MKNFKNALFMLLSIMIFTTTSFSQQRRDWVTAIKADFLWDKNLKGEGIVVMNIDTGVEYTHPGLISSWRGTVNPTGYDWFDPIEGTTVPSVNASPHGTQTMSLMVGKYTGDTIGIAPNSQWIAARIPNPGDENFTNYALACFNWVINMPPQYRPDIITCSFTDQSKGKYNFNCYDDYLEVLQQLEDLGVAVVFAAGNDGVNSDGTANMYSPQNYILSETVAFTVGSLNFDNGNYNTLSNITSRGISMCGDPTNPISYKPEILAPGDNLTVYGLNHTIQTGLSGTSFASPIFAGGYALLKQAFPNKNAKYLLEVLLYTADDLGAQGNDPEHGYGKINLQKAYNAINDGITITLKNSKTNGDNLTNSYLRVNQTDYESPSFPTFDFAENINVKPKDNFYFGFKFYKWEMDNSRIIERESEILKFDNNQFITIFSLTRPLTVRS